MNTPKSRKQACWACRQRKKRCDGTVPVCATCNKWNVKCVYASSVEYQNRHRSPCAEMSTAATPASASTPAWSADHDTALFVTHSTDAQGLYNPPMPAPPSNCGERIDQIAWDDLERYTMSELMGVSEGDSLTTAPTVSSEASTSMLPEAELPEMVNIFFNKYSPLLPCIHQKHFRDVTDLTDLYSSSSLVWAICAVVCAARSDPSTRSHPLLYLEKAKHLLEEEMVSKTQPLQSLQAAIWIIFCLFVSADFCETSVYLGKAYRYACYHHFHEIDAQSKTPSSNIFAAKDGIEAEERRKVMWALYVIDRQASCLTGNPMVIDDRYFAVNFPIDDEHFQAAQVIDSTNLLREPFTCDVKALMATKSPSSTISAATMRLFYRSTVLLGHITDYNNATQHHPATPEAKAAGFRELEVALTRAWISMPVSSIYEVPAHNLDRFVWLMFTLHKCSILLHHSAPVDVASATAPTAGPDPPGFLRAWGSVQTVLRMINQIAPLSVAPLLNPFLGPTYFLCGRFLAIRWVETRLPNFRADLDLILMLVEKTGETWRPLAEKWRKIIEHDVAKDQADVRAMKVGLGSYFELSCYVGHNH